MYQEQLIGYWRLWLASHGRGHVPLSCSESGIQSAYRPPDQGPRPRSRQQEALGALKQVSTKPLRNDAPLRLLVLLLRGCCAWLLATASAAACLAAACWLPPACCGLADARGFPADRASAARRSSRLKISPSASNPTLSSSLSTPKRTSASGCWARRGHRSARLRGTRRRSGRWRILCMSRIWWMTRGSRCGDGTPTFSLRNH